MRRSGIFSLLAATVATAAALLGAATSVGAAESSVWNPVGAFIEGETDFDRFGESIAMSDDGTVLAIGGPRNSASGDRSGHVRVFELTDEAWLQRGSDINGEMTFDDYGRDIALSADGTTLVISSAGDSPHVRVFEFEDSEWSQVGDDLVTDDETAAFQVALSADGRTLAVSQVVRVAQFETIPRVRVLSNIDGTWTQLGAFIEVDPRPSHPIIDLSDDGRRIAVADQRVHVFDFNGNVWEAVGNPIENTTDRRSFGDAVSMSGDGQLVAVGLPWAGSETTLFQSDQNGQVQVFEDVDGEWLRVGDPIEHEARGDRFGTTVALSAHGTTLAVGAPWNDGAAPGAGHVRVYDRTSGGWQQAGEDIDGIAQIDRVGLSLAVSDDGSTVAFGAPSPGVAAGYARVFERSVVVCDGRRATIVGTSGDDTLSGTEGVDVIAALQGDDTILGNGGDDIICGGIGNDVLIGGQGFDVLFGAQGNDIIFFADGQGVADRADTAGGRAFGGAGNDDIYGSSRWDRMQGGPGNDRLSGFEGRDWMRAGAGADRIEGGSNVDNIHGGNGDDYIIVSGGDVVRGGAGAEDRCINGAAAASLISCELSADD